jgi:hypothetical protein
VNKEKVTNSSIQINKLAKLIKKGQSGARSSCSRRPGKGPTTLCLIYHLNTTTTTHPTTPEAKMYLVVT